jgi:hypothetical protein
LNLDFAAGGMLTLDMGTPSAATHAAWSEASSTRELRSQGVKMDIRKIELMRQLEREYYREKKSTRKGVYVSAQVLFMYRLCLVFTIGSFIGLVIKLLSS